MSIDSHLIHTCTIQRSVTPNRTSHRDAKPQWSNQAIRVLCRLVIKAQRVADSATGERPIVTNYLLLLPAETDIRQGDRITQIIDERGLMEFGNDQQTPAIYRVAAVMPRRSFTIHHISCQLDRVGSA